MIGRRWSKATLATDAVIGAMMGPRCAGSGYVLLHHVMGEIEGRQGAWAYPQGGMGAVSDAMARSARARGVHIFTDQVSIPSLALAPLFPSLQGRLE